MRHLLTIDSLSRDDIERILERAKEFEEVSHRPIKKVPALQGRTVVIAFYEASTRTSASFDLAAKRLSAEVVTWRAAGSSVDKGESLKDTVQTLSAYEPDALVIRSPHAGAAELASRWTHAAVVNAGDGKHEHPTQALLDLYTLREYAMRYQIDAARLRPGQVLMHPGPVNRGVELAADVIDGPQAVITAQVEAGVVVRMAVLYELLAASPTPAPAEPDSEPAAAPPAATPARATA